MEVNDTSHMLTVAKKDGQSHQIDLREHGEHLSAYREKQQWFTTGDRIVFCKNDKALHVQNGVTATIKNMDERGNITAFTDNGKKIEFNAARYQYFDSGYAVTDYKSQGQTTKEVIYHAGTSSEASYNQFYTAITRGKDDVKVYTNSKENLKEQVRNEQLKTSTLDYREIEKTEGHEIEHRDPATIEPRDRDSEHYREEGKEERDCSEQEKTKHRDMERGID